MRRLTFENSRGESIEFYLSPFFINSLTGVGEIDVNLISQQSPNQDGDTHIDTILHPRFINLGGEIIETNMPQVKEYRRILSRVCNPKLGVGKITLEMDGDTHFIFGILDGGVIFPELGENFYQKFAITWKCPNPYWLTEEHVEQLVVWEGGFEFPIQLPTYFAQQSENKAKILTNEGDAETPVLVTFNGPATAPITVKNKTTEEFIEVNQSLVEGEHLVINTAFGQKRVTKVLVDGTELNAFHFISLGSIFFQLQLGNNLIDYSTGAAYERAGVTISWRNRYIGV